jgi:hypothetical protein
MKSRNGWIPSLQQVSQAMSWVTNRTLRVFHTNSFIDLKPRGSRQVNGSP